MAGIFLPMLILHLLDPPILIRHNHMRCAGLGPKDRTVNMEMFLLSSLSGFVICHLETCLPYKPVTGGGRLCLEPSLIPNTGVLHIIVFLSTLSLN